MARQALKVRKVQSDLPALPAVRPVQQALKVCKDLPARRVQREQQVLTARQAPQDLPVPREQQVQPDPSGLRAR